MPVVHELISDHHCTMLVCLCLFIQCVSVLVAPLENRRIKRYKVSESCFYRRYGRISQKNRKIWKILNREGTRPHKLSLFLFAQLCSFLAPSPPDARHSRSLTSHAILTSSGMRDIIVQNLLFSCVLTESSRPWLSWAAIRRLVAQVVIEI